MLLEETDRLAHQFFVNTVSQVGGRGLADVLDGDHAEIFGGRLDHEQKDQCDAEDSADVVDAARHKGIQVDDVTIEWQLEQGRRESELAGLRMRSSSGVNMSAIRPSAAPTNAKAAMPAASRAR